MFKVNLVHISDKVLHEGDAESVMLPGVCGELEIGNQHAPIAALLCAGRISIRTGEKDTVRVVDIHQGLVRFDGKELHAVVE